MSDFDDAIAEAWPNEEQRVARRVKLHADIDQFLDEGIIKSDGGWAAVERDHIDTFYKLVGELIDLKVERDPDGDRTVEYVLTNRRIHDMHPVFETYSPWQRGEAFSMDEKILWMDNAAREAEYAASIAKSVGDKLRFEIQDMAQAVRKEQAFKSERDELVQKIPQMDYDEASGEVFKFYAKHRNGHADDYIPVQQAMAAHFHNELNDQIEKMVGMLTSCETDDHEDFNNHIRPHRINCTKVFGDAYIKHPEIVRLSREVDQKGRAERIAKRNAQKA